MADLQRISTILPRALKELIQEWDQQKKGNQIEKDNQAHLVDTRQD